jgi:thioredoxin reductase (NADPH)
VNYAATPVEPRACVGWSRSRRRWRQLSCQAALLLAEHASRVHLVVRGSELEEDMSRYLVDQLRRHPRVEIHHNTEVGEVIGDGALHAVVIEDNLTGERRALDARAANHALA